MVGNCRAASGPPQTSPSSSSLPVRAARPMATKTVGLLMAVSPIQGKARKAQWSLFGAIRPSATTKRMAKISSYLKIIKKIRA
ncbi:hypothetical protein D3C78_1864250 [compost metagenome]